MKKLTFAFLAAVTLAIAPGALLAQSYPSKVIRIIVGFPAGGPADGSARIIGEALSKSLNQPVVVENRPGAGGTLAAAAVAQAPADGYTLFMASSGHSGNGAFYPKLPYDTLKSFAAVSGVSATPVIILVKADSPYKTIKDLLDDAVRRPGDVTVGTGGGATLTNLALEVLKSEARANILTVPYKGTSPVLTAIMSGDISAGVDTVSGSIGLIRSGRLRALAVTSAKRSMVLPDIPTVAESTTFSAFDVTGWYGLLAPAGTPESIIIRLNKIANDALATKEVASKLAVLGADTLPGSPAQFQALLTSETERWSSVIKKLGLTADGS